MNKGVDISEHNGSINFYQLKKNVDFVMIRAGYGDGTIDAKANEYSRECDLHNIPYGYYWFSYAHTVAEAINESNYLCNFAVTLQIYINI